MPDEEPVFDDGSDVEIVTDEEEPPRSQVWNDSEEFFENITEEEMAAGEFLGKANDPDDDEDNGSQWGTVENPAMTAEDFEELS